MNKLIHNTRVNLLLSLLLLLAAMIISSCSDDTTGPSGNNGIIVDTIDTYDWTIDTIFCYNCGNVYSADSNNVFIAAYPAPLHFDGINYKRIDLMDPSFICQGVAGYDKDNIFFGGGISGTYWGDPVLKKWTKGNIVSYTLTGDSGITIADIFVEGPEECWLSTSEKHRVYHFESGSIKSYPLDSGTRISIFYKDVYANLFAFPIKLLNETDYEYFYYRLYNDTFQLLSKDTVTQTSEMYLGTFRCGADFLRRGRKSILCFDGERWVTLCVTLGFHPFLIAGDSKENIVCYGQSTLGNGPWGIYTWNGTNWKQERSKYIFHGLADPAISVTNTTADIILFISGGLNYHLRGKLKK
jgi:hypothetical protein